MSEQQPIGYVRPGVLEALKADDEPHERYEIQKRCGDGFEVPIYAEQIGKAMVNKE